jgi:AbrB family looped-hinge helix DNA binding protein
MTDKQADEATLTSKGQITIPSDVRNDLGVSAGDKIRFERLKGGGYKIQGRKRRSYLEYAAKHPLPKLDRPFRDEDIDKAVGEAMTAKWERTRKRK